MKKNKNNKLDVEEKMVLFFALGVVTLYLSCLAGAGYAVYAILSHFGII